MISKNKQFKFKNKKNIFIIALIVIVLIFLILFLQKFRKVTSMEDFSSVEEVVEYMGSTYIGEEGSSVKKIKLNFKYPLYNEDKTSNEKYFNQMINTVAHVIDYRNFSLIDEKGKISITVECNRENNSITKIIINGSSNYFANLDTNKSIEEFSKINNVNISINSNILSNVINNNWQYSQSIFGTKDSFYDGYDIFFEEGIEVKNVYNSLEQGIEGENVASELNKMYNQTIFNIIFNSKYKENVINGLSTTSGLKDVVGILGNPQFGTIENGLIGYKSNNFYIFFNFKNEISVYRTWDIDKTEFSKIVGTFISNRDSNRMISDLIGIWPFYDKYDINYQSNSKELVYTIFGIKIKFNVDNEQGIVLYNNFNGNITEAITIEDIVTKKVKVPNYVYIKNTDLVFENEEKRTFYSIDTQFMKQTNNFIAYTTKINDYYNMKFISKSENYPNSELDEVINTYEWLDDNRIVYSRKNIGIYVYNILIGEKVTLLSGDEEFHIEKLENGKLYYDNKKMDIK